MSVSEQRVASLFAAIQRSDPAGTIDQFGSLAAANQYRRLYELTERYVPPGAHVLDWGCGRGHFSYFLLTCGFRVTAYSLEHEPEIFASLSESDRERLSFVRGAEGEARSLPFAGGRFGAVFSVGVLEHVREQGGDELSSLLELRRVTAGDGVFLCYHLPNRYSYIEAASRRLFGKPSGSDRHEFHEYRFTKRDIRRLCAKAGFAVVEVGRYGFLPRNSFNRLPAGLRRSRLLATVVNRSDAVLERLVRPVVQNYYFVARPSAIHENVADPNS